MRDWTQLKQWAEGLQNCPEHYDMPAEVVCLVMADLLALMAENEAARKDAERYRWLRDDCHLFEHYRKATGHVAKFDNEVDA